MPLFDVSMPIKRRMPTYPGDPKVEIKSVCRIKDGDRLNLSGLCMGTHTGTHVDPPYHFEEAGLKADQLPLELLIGPAKVFELKVLEKITASDLKELKMEGFSRVLFKTRNSELLKERGFRRNFVYLTGDAAQYLADQGIKLVGFDYLSIEEYKNKASPAHHILLSRGIPVIEGLILEGIEAGEYELICLPLKLEDGDGAPARVVLRPLFSC
ncbi:MAG: cyclase family protein [bacterium]